MNIGLRIKQLAAKKNLTLADLAKDMGKTKQAVYEMVEKEDVNTQILKTLSSLYGVPITYFFGISDDGIGEIKEKLVRLEGENEKLKQEIKTLRSGKKTPAKVVVELDVTEDEFIKMGLKDKVIQILNK